MDQSCGIYSVVAPGTIHSNLKYTVSVSLHENTKDTDVKVSLEGPSYNATKTVEVLPKSTTNVDFDVPKLKDGKYTLTAEGLKGVVFKNSTELNFADPGPNIYIQTDKAVYKPADLVQYRVLFLDANTRPAKVDEPITISIKDGSQNLIKLLKNVQLTKGVYSGKLQLSEEPVLGNWLIDISLGEGDGVSRKEKKFEVAKYVLPKFSVDIETAKDVAIDDGVIKVTVRSKYTYGKPVKGKATVSVESSHLLTGAEKSVDIDGKGQVEFDLVKDLKLEKKTGGFGFGYGYIPPAKILAVVEEELTGNKQNKTTEVHLHRSRYIFDNVDPVRDYEIGKPFLVKVYVKNLDGSPVQDTKTSAKLTLSSSGLSLRDTSSTELKYETKLDKDGLAKFEVKITNPDIYYYSVQFEFNGVDQHLQTLHKKSPFEEEKSPLKIVVQTKKPRLEEDITVQVESDVDIPYYIYTIVARGNIIKMERVNVPENRKSHTFTFKPSFDMVPTTYLYVHYVVDGNLRFEETTINFEKDLQNTIDISATEQAKPGENVTLHVKTSPESYVGLLGVDQSVLLLKSGNDLDKNAIIDDLGQLKAVTPWMRGFGRYPGRTSGLVTLTNAHYPFDTKIYFPERMYKSGITLFGGVARPATVEFAFGATAAAPTAPPPIAQPPPVRQLFPENWIFLNFENSDRDGVIEIKEKIPDTITSWVVTGFALSPTVGLGMTAEPTKIKVFQPFFVSTNLPYSVKRGEVISIPVIVFNYMEKALDTKITMDNTDREFDFTEATNEVEERPLDEVQRVKEVSVPPNSGKSVSFMIRSNKVGDITLKITALTPLAGDAIHQKLKVEPEGVTHYENRAIFVNLKDTRKLTDTLTVTIPSDVVSDSEYIEFSVVGDILGPTIKNLDKLVRMPYGCGEQNMVNFVPNILVLKYLEATGKKMPTIVEKAKKFLEVGYQRELTYKHNDGSYSAFGEGRDTGSTWLTAYVARSFIQASKYSDIDSNVIIQALDFLAQKQQENGSFPQTGRLFHPAHQNELGFTAYVLLAFLEDPLYASKYEKELEKGKQYIVENVDRETDLYALSLAAAALQVAKHPAVDKVLARLQNVAKQENDLKWWKEDEKDLGNSVEITAYILISLLETEPAGNVLPVIRWLIGQRNSFGGFETTQDTVVGLQALIKFAQKYSGGGDGKIDINFVATGTDGKQTKDKFSINADNTLLLQTYVLPKNVREVSVEAEGTGSALVQLSYHYNLASKDKKPRFTVKATVKPPKSPKLLELMVEANYLAGNNDESKESNMAVMEITLPSGYTADSDHFDEIKSAKRVQRVETKNSDTTIIIYFDGILAGEAQIFTVLAEKTHAVAKQKPAAITLYDYYIPEHRVTEYYKVESSLCDICEGDDCGASCKKNLQH